MTLRRPLLALSTRPWDRMAAARVANAGAIIEGRRRTHRVRRLARCPRPGVALPPQRRPARRRRSVPCRCRAGIRRQGIIDPLGQRQALRRVFDGRGAITGADATTPAEDPNDRRESPGPGCRGSKQAPAVTEAEPPHRRGQAAPGPGRRRSPVPLTKRAGMFSARHKAPSGAQSRVTRPPRSISVSTAEV